MCKSARHRYACGTADPNAPSVKQALDAILQRRAEQAGQSDYDRSVQIFAVVAAREVVEAVPEGASARDYLGQVQQALTRLFDIYNDRSGTYTNGRAAIGDIRLDVARLIDDLD